MHQSTPLRCARSATVVLLAGGAFVRQGVVNGELAAALGLLGSVLGDSGGYWLGRYGGRLILKRVEGNTIWRRAQALFARHGALAILLTRFVIIPLAPPINLIAGSSHYAFRRFLRFAITGELIGRSTTCSSRRTFSQANTTLGRTTHWRFRIICPWSPSFGCHKENG